MIAVPARCRDGKELRSPSIAKIERLTLALAKARQIAFVALQGGLYKDAADACKEAAKAQKKLFKARKAALERPKRRK